MKRGHPWAACSPRALGAPAPAVPLPPPADDIFGRAVWHAVCRAQWLALAQHLPRGSPERRRRLALARTHEGRIVDLAIRAEWAARGLLGPAAR